MKKALLRVTALTLIASFAMAFTGCSSKEQLVMACSADFPPYEFYDGASVVGIDAEIAQAIADKLNMELVIEDVNFDSIIAGVQAGKYDMGMSGITVTEDRLQSVNFSTPYTTAVQSIILPEGSPITSIDDLLEGDYIVAVQSGTTGDLYMTDDIGEDRMDRYTKYSDAITALNTGKVDAVCLDNQPAIAFVEANENLFILDTPYALEEYAIAINLENTELLEQVNQALAELKADGTLDAIIEKYIPAE